MTPYEANPPPIVNADAVLSVPVALQPLQSIPRQGRKSCQVRRGVEDVQLA